MLGTRASTYNVNIAVTICLHELPVTTALLHLCLHSSNGALLAIRARGPITTSVGSVLLQYKKTNKSASSGYSIYLRCAPYGVVFWVCIGRPVPILAQALFHRCVYT